MDVKSLSVFLINNAEVTGNCGLRSCHTCSIFFLYSPETFFFFFFSLPSFFLFFVFFLSVQDVQQLAFTQIWIFQQYGMNKITLGRAVRGERQASEESWELEMWSSSRELLQAVRPQVGLYKSNRLYLEMCKYIHMHAVTGSEENHTMKLAANSEGYMGRLGGRKEKGEIW